jgi:hypothetical protein
MVGVKLTDFSWPLDAGTGEVDIANLVAPAVESFSRSLTVTFSISGSSYFIESAPEYAEHKGIPCFALMTGEDGEINWGEYDFFNVSPMLKVFTDDLDMMADDPEEVEAYRENIIECLEGLIAGVRAHKVEEPC